MGHSNDRTDVNNSNGTMTRLTNGTAKIFAMGAISDVCEKKSNSSGVKPKAMKTCTLAHWNFGVGKRCWLIKQ